MATVLWHKRIIFKIRYDPMKKKVKRINSIVGAAAEHERKKGRKINRIQSSEKR